MILRETEVFAGVVGLQFYLLDRGATATPEIEQFYRLKRAWWDQGGMLEATREVVRYAFEALQLQRLTRICYRENLRSANVIRRVGMTVGPRVGNPAGEMPGVLENPATQSADA